jgi:hypothetical protein
MTPMHGCSSIAQLLSERIGSLVRELVPEGERHGHKWLARCPWRSDRTPGSFMITLDGRYAGHWIEWATGERGDALDLVAKVRGIPMAEALGWALNWLGIAASGKPQPTICRPVALLERPCAARSSATLEFARRIWRESLPPGGTLVSTYLAGRGLAVPVDAPLRYHPACPRGTERWPAMVAQMTDAETGEPVGVHRTYLARDGSGKAPGAMPAKMMVGKAGVIRLTPDEAVTIGIGIAEGIETALAVMQRAGWSPVWAATSAGAMQRFPVLAGIEALTLFADMDSAGLAAARECGRRWAAAGREARLLAPPAGDWDSALPRAGEAA